jgi:hypothetical protein
MELISEFGHQAMPLYWAGFIIVGNGSIRISLERLKAGRFQTWYPNPDGLCLRFSQRWQEPLPLPPARNRLVLRPVGMVARGWTLASPSLACPLTCAAHAVRLWTCPRWFNSGTFRTICIASSRRELRWPGSPCPITSCSKFAAWRNPQAR